MRGMGIRNHLNFETGLPPKLSMNSRIGFCLKGSPASRKKIWSKWWVYAYSIADQTVAVFGCMWWYVFRFDAMYHKYALLSENMHTHPPMIFFINGCQGLAVLALCQLPEHVFVWNVAPGLEKEVGVQQLVK